MGERVRWSGKATQTGFCLDGIATQAVKCSEAPEERAAMRTAWPSKLDNGSHKGHTYLCSQFSGCFFFFFFSWCVILPSAVLFIFGQTPDRRFTHFH